MGRELGPGSSDYTRQETMARKRGPTCRVKREAWLRPLDKQVGTRGPFVFSSKQRDRLNRGGYNHNHNNNNNDRHTKNSNDGN